MVYMPSERGEKHKLRRTFHGPYRVLKVNETNAEVRLMDSPTDDSSFVKHNRNRWCHPEQGITTWTGEKKRPRK